MSAVTTQSVPESRDPGRLILTTSGQVIYRGRGGTTTIAPGGILTMDMSGEMTVLFTPGGVTFKSKGPGA